MSGKRRRPPIYSAGRRVSLGNVQDTGATTDAPLPTPEKKAHNADYEFVEPQTFPNSDTVKWGDLKLAGRIVLFVVSVVGVIVPAIWYLSKLDFSVDRLKTDVQDVKQKTETLIERSIQHAERLESLEKPKPQSDLVDRKGGK